MRGFGGFIMTKCPFCDSELVEERRELVKGVWATVEICPNCRDEWIDEVGHDWLLPAGSGAPTFFRKRLIKNILPTVRIAM